MTLKIDLHTHSITSPDGSIQLEDYKESSLDCIAITDHNDVKFAQKAQKELGADKIIVGEEITTSEGEIIGLYLTDVIPEGRSAKETVALIKRQGGLVYIPHPFETVRQGITMEILETIADSVDIIEAPNGRSLQAHDAIAQAWAAKNGVAVAGSSDAHRKQALGKTFTTVYTPVKKQTLKTALLAGNTHYSRPTILDITAPKYNRIMKKLRKNT
jgi:predicted metal-dependent phosphoesterase TrpH